MRIGAGELARPRKEKGRAGRPKGTGSQQAYDTLRKRILRLELAPGADIDENALVKEFGISRTPVREALIRLSADGLIRLQANRGARVSPLDINEIPELLEALELCMRLTNRWAALRRTDEQLAKMHRSCAEWAQASQVMDVHAMNEANNALHLTIAEASGNRHLAGLYRSLLPGFLRLTSTLLSTAPLQVPEYRAYYRRIDTEHRQIVEIISAQDADAADEMARKHASLTRERVATFMQASLVAALPSIDPAEAAAQPTSAPAARRR